MITREEALPEDVRIHRARELVLLSVLASLAAIACSVLNVVVYGTGPWGAYVVPLIYPAVMAAGQLGFAVSRQQNKASWLYAISISHVLLLSILPSAFMVVMGSFEACGGAVIWTAMAPLTSYVLFKSRRTSRLFLALSLLTMAAAFAITGLEELGCINFRDREMAIPRRRWHAVTMSIVMSFGICAYATALVSKLHHQVLARTEAFDKLVSEVAPAPVAMKFQMNANTKSGGSTFLPMLPSSSDSNLKPSGLKNNIGLPTVVAPEPLSLYSGIFGPVSARKHPNVSIVSVGVAGFESLLEVTTAEEVVVFLNNLYAVLDKEAKKFGMTKIRTVGHTYVAAAGMMSDYDVEKDSQHPELRSGLFALGVQRFARDILQLPNGGACDLQVGVASGPVFSAVVGIRRPQFDVFGHVAEVADNLRRTCDSQCAHVSAKAWESLNNSIQMSFGALQRIEGEHVDANRRRMMGVAEDMWAVRLSHNQHLLAAIDRAAVISSSLTEGDSKSVKTGSSTATADKRRVRLKNGRSSTISWSNLSATLLTRQVQASPYTSAPSADSASSYTLDV